MKKTVQDLNALIPAIIDEVCSRDHAIGVRSVYYEEEEGCGFACCEDEGESNYYSYEKDGWCVEVLYDCCGEWVDDPGDRWTPGSFDLKRAWCSGEAEIFASWTDDETGDTIEFEGADLEQIQREVDQALKYTLEHWA